MTIQSITKKRVAAAVATLTIGGAGLAVTGLGGGASVQVKAGKSGEQQASAATTATEGASNGAPVRLVARRAGVGRFTIEPATSATEWTGSATAQGSVATTDVAAAIETTVSGAKVQPGRPDSHRLPRKVEVGLPTYEGGRPPSATAPSVDGGTAPTVEPGWTTTIDLGEAPTVGAPSVDPGESGTFHPPTVHVS